MLPYPGDVPGFGESENNPFLKSLSQDIKGILIHLLLFLLLG